MNHVTVEDYFRHTFPTFPLSIRQAKDLRSMPLESNCGEDCGKAIISSLPLLEHITNAYGEGSDKDRRMRHLVAETVLNVCLTYICG